MLPRGLVLLFLVSLVGACGTSTTAERDDPPTESSEGTEGESPASGRSPDPPPSVRLELDQDSQHRWVARIINTSDRPTQLLSALLVEPSEEGTASPERLQLNLVAGPEHGSAVQDIGQSVCLTLLPGAELVLPALDPSISAERCPSPCLAASIPAGEYRFGAQSCDTSQKVLSAPWRWNPEENSGTELINSAQEEAAPAPQDTR